MKKSTYIIALLFSNFLFARILHNLSFVLHLVNFLLILSHHRPHHLNNVLSIKIINIINILHNSAGHGSLRLLGHIKGAKQAYVAIQSNSISLQLIAANKHITANVIRTTNISAKNDIFECCLLFL